MRIRFLRLTLAASLVLLPAEAQETIPLTQYSCASGGILNCHWDNGKGCSYNSSLDSGSDWVCSTGMCMRYIDRSQCTRNGEGTMTIYAECCASNLEMNAQCTENVGQTITETITTFPCC